MRKSPSPAVCNYKKSGGFVFGEGEKGLFEKRSLFPLSKPLPLFFKNFWTDCRFLRCKYSCNPARVFPEQKKEENKNKLLTETGTLSPLTFQFFQKRPGSLRLDLAFDSGQRSSEIFTFFTQFLHLGNRMQHRGVIPSAERIADIDQR